MQILAAAVGGLAALVAVAVVAKALLARRRLPAPPAPSLAIDLASLGDCGPPAVGPSLECYNVPVRLAVMVLAPVGRGGIPSLEKLPAVIDQITPNLSAVFDAHATLVKQWPPQLSPRGFAHAFFAQVKLPGERGRGTPWCALAGRVECDPPLMVGLALCAATPNSLGQFAVERSGQWLDALRVRE